MLVPFISWEPRNVQFGTDAIAPPGALIHTPSAPSWLQSVNYNMSALRIDRCTDKRRKDMTHPQHIRTHHTYDGPRDDQVYCVPGRRSNIEYSALIISGDT